MTIEELVKICSQGGRRPVALDKNGSGVVAALGLEGRLFYIHKGQIVSLFRPESVVNFSDSKNGYFNPGGDGLWPAPEGTSCGYEYAAGNWRVPMGLVNVQYKLDKQTDNSLKISGEIDLINSRQLGIPTRFSREVTVSQENGATVLQQDDVIEYIGNRTLQEGEFLLAPWSLSQFDVTADSYASFKTCPVRDLYSPSKDNLKTVGDTTLFTPNSEQRIQLALSTQAQYVELTLPHLGIRIRRTAAASLDTLPGADIADAPVDVAPATPVRYSIYNDPSSFFELEVVGHCQFPLTHGTRLHLLCTTTISNL